MGSRVRAMRRRLRCARRGHYWVQRLDADLRVELFCCRCGHLETGVERVARLAASHRSV